MSKEKKTLLKKRSRRLIFTVHVEAQFFDIPESERVLVYEKAAIGVG